MHSHAGISTLYHILELFHWPILPCWTHRRFHRAEKPCRSTNSILELAASILDLITHFFPEKLDKLPKETSRVTPGSWCRGLELQNRLAQVDKTFSAVGFIPAINLIIIDYHKIGKALGLLGVSSMKFIRSNSFWAWRDAWGRAVRHQWSWTECALAMSRTGCVKEWAEKNEEQLIITISDFMIRMGIKTESLLS